MVAKTEKMRKADKKGRITLFPDFAGRFFNVVCAGGVECVVDVMRDYECGSLKPIYRSPQSSIRRYELDYRFMRKSGVTVPIHFVEASRGCNFKCDFCSIPAEKAARKYTLTQLVSGITPENRHAEIHTGPSVGAEAW